MENNKQCGIVKMGGIKLLVSILMIFVINEYGVLDCTGVEEVKLLKRNLPKDDPEKQVGLLNALIGLKLAILNLILEFKLGLPDNIDALKRDCESKNHKLKLEREMFQSSSKEEKDNFMGKLKVIKDLTGFGPLAHNRKDQSKEIIGLSKELILKQAILDLIQKLGSDQKDTLKRDYKRKNHECKLKREMFQTSSKEEKDDLMSKFKVIKYLPDFGLLLHNGKDQPKEKIRHSNELILKQAFLDLMVKLRSDQKVTLKRYYKSKNHECKLKREMFQSSSKEKKDDLMGKLKLMKEMTDFSPKNKENKDLELNHVSVLNNDDATGQFAERIPVIITSPEFAEIGWKEVFGRKSQNEHHKACNNRKTKDVKADGKAKKMDVEFSSKSIQSDDHNAKSRVCEGDEYKRIACNVCQCDDGRWRCTSLACHIKQLSDYHYLNSLKGTSKEMYNKFREKATGCIPGEEINVDGMKDCPCVCVLPSVMECEICPAVMQIFVPKKKFFAQKDHHETARVKTIRN